MIKDTGDVKRLNKRAFMQALGHASKADLVDRLCENCASTLSLVAVQDDRIVCHIISSRYRDPQEPGLALHHRAWTSRIRSSLRFLSKLRIEVSTASGKEFPMRLL